MPRLRYQSPDRLVHAADFSSVEELRGSLNAVRLVKSQKWVWDQLREACDLEVRYARRREPGDWSLAAVAYITPAVWTCNPGGTRPLKSFGQSAGLLHDRATQPHGDGLHPGYRGPRRGSTDRGVSLSACFEHATRAGTAPIFPSACAGRRTSTDGSSGVRPAWDQAVR